jgi:hypothetical protein
MSDGARKQPGVTRRDFVRKVGLATGIAATGLGLQGILAVRKAPAYAPGTSLHFLLWKNFSPPADVELMRQGTEWGKQNHVNVKIEQINGNDIPARAAAAMENKQGPDIVQFFHDWQNQYANGLVDVTDICTTLESKYGGYLEYAKAHATLKGQFTAVPHTIVPNIYVVRMSYLKAAGTKEWPNTWEELRREGKKWKAAGRPIGQTVAHTFGDAVAVTHPYLWSFGAAEQDENGRVAIEDKQALEALRFFKALWDDTMDSAGIGWDDSSNNRATMGLLRLGGEARLDPLPPAALERIHLQESVLPQLLCHPGTGRLGGSGAVRDNGLLFGILLDPAGDVSRILPNRTRDLQVARLPVPANAQVQDDQLGGSQSRSELFLCHPGDVVSPGRCEPLTHCCPGERYGQ